MKLAAFFLLIFLSSIVNAQQAPVKWATQESFFDALEGKPLPNFHGLTIDGKPFDSKELKGGIVVINFWFENCPPCIAEMPELNQLVTKHANKKVRFIGITHDLPRRAKRFQKRIPYYYQVISLTKEEIAKLNINHGFPSNILVGKDGKILYAMANFSPSIPGFKVRSVTFDAKLDNEIENLQMVKQN